MISNDNITEFFLKLISFRVCFYTKTSLGWQKTQKKGFEDVDERNPEFSDHRGKCGRLAARQEREY